MWIAGIDLGGSKAALSLYQNHKCRQVLTFKESGTREEALYGVSDALGEVLSYLNHGDAVYIEEPLIGPGVRASMQVVQMCGAVMAAVRSNTAAKQYLIPVNTWKKKVCGKGNLGKPAIASWLKTNHPLYADMCGTDQDRIDAVCIGMYGYLNSSESRELDLSR